MVSAIAIPSTRGNLLLKLLKSTEKYNDNIDYRKQATGIYRAAIRTHFMHYLRKRIQKVPRMRGMLI